nr:hypothetical protein CFP56_59156 [Quercus suber]
MLNGTSTLKAKYEVTIILDALDYANVQRIDPNRLHIRYSCMFGWVYEYNNGANRRMHLKGQLKRRISTLV